MKKLLQPDNYIFTRGDVAKVLNVSPLTIANREKAQKYPEPKRSLNSYRVYSLRDVLKLQLITYDAVDPRPILAVLYDKGFRDIKEIASVIDLILGKREEGTKQTS